MRQSVIGFLGVGIKLWNVPKGGPWKRAKFFIISIDEAAFIPVNVHRRLVSDPILERCVYDITQE
jgi:hypothetical protein